jgi:methyl halide transferase
MLTQNLPDFWEKKYSNGDDGWDLGKPTPALESFFNTEFCPKEGKVLVLGAGRGFDALAWAQKGHSVVAVDFCPTAVDSLESLSRKYENMDSLDIDLFELDPKKHGQFDIIYEYTCFSAIHPGRRDEFFEVWYKMLKDEGLIISLFYPLSNENPNAGPPHPTSEGELMARLDGIFDISNRVKPENSIPDRVGKEEFWLLKKVI